jgi:hypothetical protein
MMASAWLNVCWLMTGGWVMLSENIQLPLSFQRIFVMWPRATSLTSISTSSLRCRFHTWWPV